MLEVYNGLLSRSRSLNDIARIHVAFGNTITPQEATELEETLFVNGYQMPNLREDRTFSDEELIRDARVWAETMLEELKVIGKRQAEPFLRHDVRKSVTLYSKGGTTADKSLVVTLPGANHRLMMGIPTFLQNMNAETTDVLIVRDGTRSGYREGLEGLAPAVEDLGPALHDLLDISAYRRCVGLGVSAGGLPILLVSLQMDFEAVLVCGGSSPYRNTWEGRQGRPLPADTLRAAAGDGRHRRITVAFGAQSDRDRQGAMDIAECIAVTPLEVAIEDLDIGHNILLPLSMRRQLPAFFAEHLGLEM